MVSNGVRITVRVRFRVWVRLRARVRCGFVCFFFRLGKKMFFLSVVLVWPEMGMMNMFSYLRSMMICLFRAWKTLNPWWSQYKAPWREVENKAFWVPAGEFLSTGLDNYGVKSTGFYCVMKSILDEEVVYYGVGEAVHIIFFWQFPLRVFISEIYRNSKKIELVDVPPHLWRKPWFFALLMQSPCHHHVITVKWYVTSYHCIKYKLIKK